MEAICGSCLKMVSTSVTNWIEKESVAAGDEFRVTASKLFSERL